MTARWLIPTLLYVIFVGALGITSKLALRSLAWPDLVMWTAAGYVAAAAVLIGLGQASPGLGPGTGWAVLSAAMAIGALIALYVALNSGEASTIIPLSAAYPAVTLVLAAVFLSEAVTAAKAGGLALVLAGVVLLTSGN